MLFLSIKKGHKQIDKNYQPILQQLICGKIFASHIFNSMFEFLMFKNVISPNKATFKPIDFCINQLLSIVQEICESFLPSGITE